MTTETVPNASMISQLQQLLPSGMVSTETKQLAASATSSPVLPPGRLPLCILRPARPDELQALICFANQAGLNLTVTSSTGTHRHGGISNPEENNLIDLSGWGKIDLIDRRNRVCRVEPGVTYGQLIPALAEHGMTMPMPLAPRSGKSVLASVMDREPTTWPNKQWDSSDPVGSTEFFFGSGERFRSGAAGGPGTIEQQRLSGGAQKFSSGPSQTDFHRVIQGAQGTLGILTWITLRTELKPTLQNNLLASSERLENLLPFVYAVQRGLLGEQTFILDRTAAAMLMANGDANAYTNLRSELPPYLCLQTVAGFERLPQEHLDYHMQAIRGFAQGFNLRLEEGIGPVSASDLLDRATQPCGEIDWRDTLRGSSLSVFFLSTLDRMPAFRKVFLNTALEFGIPEAEIGIYLQPTVQNHACQVEFILPFVPFDPNAETERERIKQFERQAVMRLMEAGAFFSRPYGSAAELVWAQNPANYQLVKTVKRIFDPRRVLQRGKWGL
jgi:FAD/FMN-containing dehydrogenase